MVGAEGPQNLWAPAYEPGSVRDPAHREGVSPADVMGRYQRRSEEVDAMMVEAYVSGVSQRKMGDVTEALMGERVGRSTVRVAKRLDEGVHAAECTHRGGPPNLDARSSMPAPERSERERVRGLRRGPGWPPPAPWALTLGPEESENSWSELLEQLLERGLSGVQLADRG